MQKGLMAKRYNCINGFCGSALTRNLTRVSELGSASGN